MLEELLERLKRGGEQTLYHVGGESLTYAACGERVQRLAQVLRAQGSGPVIVYGHKSVMQFVSILACVVARRCYIPVDPHTPQARICEIASQADARLALVNEPLHLPTVKCLSPEKLEAEYSYPYMETETVTTNEMAYIIFTSGSTGKSKGVPISYENLDHFISWITQVEALLPFHGARVLSVSRFSFDLSVMDIYFSIFTQSTIITAPYEVRENLLEFFETMRRSAVEFVILTPTLAKLLLLEERFTADHFPSLRGFFFCGECLEVATARKLHARFPQAAIINAYGPTECTCCVTLVEITEDMLQGTSLPVGRSAGAAVEVLLEDEEIVLRGDSVFSGYLGLCSENAYREQEGAVFHTRDLGKLEEGLLYCRGRKDHQIKYQGYRIELGDIENNLLKIDGIVAAVACAKRKAGSEVVKMIRAYVVTENETLTEEAIKRALLQKLPAYMIPKSIVFLDEIPINANGKYDRRKLEER